MINRSAPSVYVQMARAKLATYVCLCFVARKSIQLLRHYSLVRHYAKAAASV